MNVRVFIEPNDFACCGDGFAPGDVITWAVRAFATTDPMVATFSREFDQSVGYWCDLPAHDRKGLLVLRGIVLEILEIGWDHPELWETNRPVGPIPGTGASTAAELIDRSCDHSLPNFQGWIADVHAVRPIQPV